MRKINSLFVLTTLIFVLGVQLNAMVPGNPFAQQDNTQAQPQQDQDKMQPPSDSEKATVFTGKVMKAKGQYVLMDNTTKVTYILDDQEKAKAFNGKTVKVTGTLEVASNTIHIANIAPAA
jgi:hypothetical protein